MKEQLLSTTFEQTMILRMCILTHALISHAIIHCTAFITYDIHSLSGFFNN